MTAFLHSDFSHTSMFLLMKFFCLFLLLEQLLPLSRSSLASSPGTSIDSVELSGLFSPAKHHTHSMLINKTMKWTNKVMCLDNKRLMLTLRCKKAEFVTFLSFCS